MSTEHGPSTSGGDDAQRQAAAAGGSAEALLKRLEWSVIRKLDGLLQGDYRTVWRGAGMDLADLREYQYHDDVRHIDWNVTARLQVPHVRQFTEDRDLAAWFLVDLSASVDFGSVEEAGKTRRRTKRDVACEFVAVLARLLTRHGNRVGAMLYGTAVDTVIPARSGRLHVLQLLQRMVRRPLVSPKGATRLSELLKAGETFFKRRSTVFIVSDFYSDPGWEVALSRLTARHDVVAMRLFDPLESELPDVGLLTLTDAETGEQVTVDTEDAGFRRRFAAIAARREAGLQAMLAKAGVDTIEIATDDDLLEAVLRFVDMRRQRERRTAGSAGNPALAIGHLAVAADSPTSSSGGRYAA
jgi:uncharacterized protein (DUF58 family)